MYKTPFLLILINLLCIDFSYSQSLSTEDIFLKYDDRVVLIKVFDEKDSLKGTGSGVIIGENGEIVTNYHVFGGSKNLVVEFKKNNFSDIKIVGADIERDILIIKCNGVFPYATIGNSDSLKVGNKIYAIGNALGVLSNTISDGIISGLRKEIPVNHITRKYFDLIQFTAAISSGNSGGALVNDRGELIGICTFSIEDNESQNLNFAIPINDVIKIKRFNFKQEKENKAIYDYFRGYNALLNNSPDLAIKYFSKYIEVFPDNADAYKYRGYCYSNLEDKNNAIKDYEKAIELDPDDAIIHFNNGNKYKQLKQYEKAVEEYQNAIDIDSNYLICYVSLGDLYLEIGDFDKAFENYFRVKTIDSNETSVYNRLGKAYSLLEKNREAIIEYSKSLRLNPENYLDYFNRGNRYMAMGAYDTAIWDYTRAISYNNSLYTALINRSLCYFKLNDIDKALQDLNKAESIEPSNEIIYYTRGIILLKVGKPQDALKNLDEAILIKPKWEFYQQRGYANLELSNHNEALEDFNKVIEINENDISSIWGKAQSLYFLKQYDEVEYYCNQLIELGSKFFEPYNLMATMYLDKKDYEKSLLYYSKSIRNDTNFTTLPPKYLNRAVVYKRIKKYEEALNDLDSALKINPHDQLLYFNKGAIFSEMGKYQEAISNFDSTLKYDKNYFQAYFQRATCFIMIFTRKSGHTVKSDLIN